MSSSEKAMILKLLEKAGSDPRLTPRLLREKAEQRLQLDKGSLKSKRNLIKDWIVEWYRQKKIVELKALVKLAKASGLAPQIFKGLSELTDEDKVVALRKRLVILFCFVLFFLVQVSKSIFA